MAWWPRSRWRKDFPVQWAWAAPRRHSARMRGSCLSRTEVKMEIPVPMTQALATDGKLYRVTDDGKLHLVASDFINPVGVEFTNDALLVTDINGDFIAGKRELPDGFIVKIQLQ